MIPLFQSKKNKKIKITNKNKSIERCENNFARKTSKIFLFFLLLIISIEKFKAKINYIKNKSKNPIFSNYFNSTLKNQYFTRFDNVFTSYKNETELSDEYKNKFKKYLLDGYSSLFKKKYKKIDVIIFNKTMNFGNAIFVINNLIYFCEILGCTKIYLHRDYWFIKKPIYDKELNITISPLNIDIWNNQSSIYFDSKSTFPNKIIQW
jgi:hypothetical protein